jgi:phosphatidylglycerol:prolipoprotein diacylglycerol transferase
VVRIFGEQFREPDAGLIMGLTRGEVYSLPMIVVGLGFIVFALGRKPASA